MGSMGQAAVDLPDPLETPPAGAPPGAPGAGGAAGTDELLSQLAGEEINRLLAEADLGPDNGSAAGASAPPANTTPADLRATSAAASAPDADPVLDAQLDDLMLQLGGGAPAAPRAETTPAPAPPPAPPAAGAVPAPLISADLDQVFEQMTGGHLATSATAPEGPMADTVSAPAQEPQGASDVGRVLDSVVTRDAEADAAAAEDVAAVAPEESAALHGHGGSHDSGDDGGEATARRGAMRWRVRLLKILNAPWEFVPEPLLDAAGKVGVLTLLNALAVLLYVLLFRRK